MGEAKFTAIHVALRHLIGASLTALRTHVYVCTCMFAYVWPYTTCKRLLNTLGRAVEQLAGCLAKETVEVEVQQSCNAELYLNGLMNIYEYLIKGRNATWIAVNLASPIPECVDLG